MNGRSIKYLVRRLDIREGDKDSLFNMVYMEGEASINHDGLPLFKNIVTCPFDKERAGYSFFSYVLLIRESNGYKVVEQIM